MNSIIGSTSWDSFLQLIVVLVIFIFVLLITIYTTRWIGGYQKSQMTNRNMKIIETMKIGNNKFMALIQIGEIYLVVGIGKDEIHTIAKLNKEELPEILESMNSKDSNVKESFQEILEKYRNKKG